MNSKVLHKAEKLFLERYPGGFTHPDMQAMAKKHKMDQLTGFAKESFAKAQFDDPSTLVANVSKLVSRSTMVSLFEKPRFRDAITSLTPKGQQQLSASLYELLHGKEKAGFEAMLEILAPHKLAKWTLMTTCQVYYRPKRDVFVKPTTAKLIIEKLGIDLKYQAKPTWTFYKAYRQHIQELAKQADATLFPSTAAFCGFLMTTLPDV